MTGKHWKGGMTPQNWKWEGDSGVSINSYNNLILRLCRPHKNYLNSSKSRRPIDLKSFHKAPTFSATTLGAKPLTCGPPWKLYLNYTNIISPSSPHSGICGGFHGWINSLRRLALPRPASSLSSLQAHPRDQKILCALTEVTPSCCCLTMSMQRLPVH